jgi:N-acetyltransferase 10
MFVLDLPRAQLLGLLNTMLRNLTKSLRMVQEQSIAKSFQSKKIEVLNGSSQEGLMAPLPVGLNSELEEAAKELKMKQVSELNKLKGHLDFQQYAIKGNDDEWDQALKIKDTTKIAKLVSVKTGEKRASHEQEPLDESTNNLKKKKKHKDKEKSNPKKKII